MAGIDKYTLALFEFDDPTNIAKDSMDSGIVSSTDGAITISSDGKFGSAWYCPDAGNRRIWLNGSFLSGNEWTIDYWLKMIGNDPYSCVVGRWTDTGPHFLMGPYHRNNAGSIVSWRSSFGTEGGLEGKRLWNTWNHYAVVRTEDRFYYFIDGVLQGTGVAERGASYCPSDGYICIGNNGSTANQIIGYIDEIRISTVARWTKNFTPPQLPYDKGVKLLLTDSGALFGGV